MLTSVSWIGGATGYWDVAANWSNDAVPTSATDVTIPTSGATVTIRAGDIESVNSLTVAAGDTLSIVGGSLTTAAGLTNSGTIIVNRRLQPDGERKLQPGGRGSAFDARRRRSHQSDDELDHQFGFRVARRDQQHYPARRPGGHGVRPI